MRPKIGHDRSTMRSRTDRPPWRLSRIRIIRPRTPQEDQKSLPSQFGQNCDIKKAGNTWERFTTLLNTLTSKLSKIGSVTYMPSLHCYAE